MGEFFNEANNDDKEFTRDPWIIGFAILIAVTFSVGWTAILILL